MNLYQAIAEADVTKTNRVVTVVRGPHAGEKLLVSDGAAAWQPDGSEFLAEHLPELAGLPESGLAAVGEDEVFSEVIRRERRWWSAGAGMSRSRSSGSPGCWASG